ncbi:hypothetical protein ACM66B_003768 [Microbotryomycetes sp. NB124-2]
MSADEKKDEHAMTAQVEVAPSSPTGAFEREVACPELPFGKFRWTKPVLYLVFLVFWNIAVPCVLFYALDYLTSMDDGTIIGISSAALGISSFIDMPIRLYKLIWRRDRYAPPDLDGQVHKWYFFDATMLACAWILGFFAVPLSVAPAIPTFPFFLFSFGMLVLAAVLLALVSLKSFRLPVKLSSQARGAMSRPLAFYVLEDVVAVDFGRGRPWRLAVNARYEASPPFRQSMRNQTIMWAASGAIFVGASAAIAWTVPLVIAFALNLCLFFIWLGLTMLAAWWLGLQDLERERDWWNSNQMVTM